MSRAIFAFLALFFFNTVHAASMFEIIPVELHRDYTVSGFIATDGTLGELTEDNILDYRINVDGRWGIDFSPSNPDVVDLNISRVFATETDIRLMGLPSFFGGLAFEELSPQCSDECDQTVLWQITTRRSTGETVHVVSYEVFGGPNFSGPSAFLAEVSNDNLVIAKAIPVPEPEFATLTLMLLLFIALGLRNSHGHRHHQGYATH